MSKPRKMASQRQIMEAWGLEYWVCVWCGEHRGVERGHIVAHRLGGSGEATNLIPMCRKHNRVFPEFGSVEEAAPMVLSGLSPEQWHARKVFAEADGETVTEAARVLKRVAELMPWDPASPLLWRMGDAIDPDGDGPAWDAPWAVKVAS